MSRQSILFLNYRSRLSDLLSVFHSLTQTLWQVNCLAPSRAGLKEWLLRSVAIELPMAETVW